MTSVLDKFCRFLMFLACLSMVLAFASIILGVAAREFGWDIQGLDAYAGYAVAAALFLALPGTLKHGDHIRVTLVMQRLPAKAQNALEYWCLLAASALMALTIWGSTSSWTLTALPLFLWMGEILFRSKLSEDMFKGLAPWLNRLPGRLLHVNVIDCTIFAAVSGSSAATCATIGKITLPELKKRGYPEDISIGTLAGAGTLGLLIPPSIIMIVYGVAANVSIAKLFIAGVIPGVLLAVLFSGYIIVWSLLNPGKIPKADEGMRLMQKLYASRNVIPVVSLIALVVEMAQITPPVGFNLFVIQGLTKKEITYIARTAFPLFVLLMAAVLATYFFQDIVLLLPRKMT